MNKQRIRQILETYRPGEDMESDPEVRQALDAVARDPEAAAIKEQIQAFDQAFRERLNSINPPPGLYEAILAEADAEASPPRANSRLLHWMHPAIFAAAASIVILLALSFTFWNRPVTSPQSGEAVATEVRETANLLYASMTPSFRTQKGSEVLDYLKAKEGLVPTGMPSCFDWERTFACDVLEVDGKRVSLICFRPEQGSNTLHLFTFSRADFPDCKIPQSPFLDNSGKSCSALWADEEQIHVLYSDQGEENLRQILEI